jgi:hypothetical protein
MTGIRLFDKFETLKHDVTSFIPECADKKIYLQYLGRIYPDKEKDQYLLYVEIV